jgi:hypothetical protein
MSVEPREGRPEDKGRALAEIRGGSLFRTVPGSTPLRPVAPEPSDEIGPPDDEVRKAYDESRAWMDRNVDAAADAIRKSAGREPTPAEREALETIVLGMVA